MHHSMLPDLRHHARVVMLTIQQQYCTRVVHASLRACTMGLFESVSSLLFLQKTPCSSLETAATLSREVTGKARALRHRRCFQQRCTTRLSDSMAQNYFRFSLFPRRRSLAVQLESSILRSFARGTANHSLKWQAIENSATFFSSYEAIVALQRCYDRQHFYKISIKNTSN